MKYDEVYMHAYERVSDVVVGLTCYFTFYNRHRPHRAMDDRTPEEYYRGQEPLHWAA